MTIMDYWRFRGAFMLIQSVLGMLVFAYNLQKRDQFLVRLAGATALLMLLSRLIGKLFLDCLFTTPTDGLGRILVSLLCYMFLFIISWLSFDESFMTVMFITSAGYIAQDVGGSVKGLIRLLPEVMEFSNAVWGMLLLDIIVFPTLFFLLFIIFRPFTQNADENFGNRTKALFSTGALLLCILAARLTDGNVARNTQSIFVEEVYQILCGILLLLLQFGVMERTRLEYSVDSMRRMVYTQREQSRKSSQLAELINEKYHDLKGLLENSHGQMSPEQLESLEEEIGTYDIYVRTGNQILDIVLAEKRGICDREKITFTCYANGTGMEFVEELDLYSLVGNALNNAIDAVIQLPKEERFISLLAKCADGMLLLHVENPFRGTIELEGGLPKSHRDERYHGFGMKSMQRISEKYDGTLTIQSDNGLFSLNILLIKS